MPLFIYCSKQLQEKTKDINVIILQWCVCASFIYPLKTIEMVGKSAIYEMRGSLCHKKQKFLKKARL